MEEYKASAIGMALIDLGTPLDDALEYEKLLKENRFLLIIFDDKDAIDNVEEMLKKRKFISISKYDLKKEEG